MTRRFARNLLLTLMLLGADGLLGGCGSSANQPSTGVLHGGTLVALPESQGFVEILKQAAPGKPGRSVVVVYFLDRDQKPMTPVPTSATFKGSTTGDKPIPLKPVGGADAAKAEGLASEPIADRGEIEGELTASLGGSPITVAVMLR